MKIVSKALQSQAQEFHRLIECIGLSQRQIAARLNINQREFRRYVAGGLHAPGYVRLGLVALNLEAEKVSKSG